MKLSTKLTIPIVLLNIILITLVYIISNHLINQKFRDNYTDSLQSQAIALEEEFALLERNASNSCKWFENSARIITSIQNNDLPSIANLSDTAKAAFNLDFFMIINKDGSLFYRSDEPDAFGMDMTGAFHPFQTAIQGQIESGIYILNDIPFICATSPVYDNENNVIATITTGYNLSLESFVDYYNALLENEITIFFNDTRVMTTLTNESGNRIIGSQLTDPVIIDEVLVKQNHYYGQTVINNQSYLCAYIPFADKQGNVIILFVGKNIESVKTIAESTSRTIIVVVSVVACFIVIIMISFIYLFIRRPVKKLTSKLYEVKPKDSDTCNLTVRVPDRSKDEMGAIGRQFNDLLDNIQNIVLNINETCQALSTASETLAASSEETAATASEVTNSMSNISNAASYQSTEANRGVETAHVISDELTEIMDNAGNMKSAADETGNVTKIGMDSVTLLKETSEKNTLAIQQMSEKVLGLNEKSETMGSILEVITSIASQTNLLSLNAAIEAARAGEAGKGFAVVADEVRSLAEQSADSTQNIRQLLTDIQTEIKNTVSLMSAITKSIEEQNNVVENTQESFHNISDSIESIIKNIKQVSDAIIHMESSQGEIVGAINSISDMSKSTSDSAELVNHSVNEMSTAVEDIAELAQNLNEISQKLKTDIANFVL